MKKVLFVLFAAMIAGSGMMSSHGNTRLRLLMMSATRRGVALLFR